jgi:hypothetical protein
MSVELVGDAVSRLLQLHAHRNGVRKLKWSGKGPEDIAMLCLDNFHKTALSECLWNGMKELMAMPEMKELPESMQAQIYSIVLKAQANFELKKGDNAGKQPPPTGAVA